MDVNVSMFIEIQKQIEKLEDQARKEANPRKKFDLVQRARELGERNEKLRSIS